MNPCEHCLANGDLKKCRQAECQFHNAFIVRCFVKIIRKINKFKKRTIFINSKDHFDRENPENNYHGWSDPEHMKECIQSLLKFYHYAIQYADIDTVNYDTKYPIDDIETDDSPCRYCTANSSIEKCLKAECQIHETFIFKQLSTKLRNIKYRTENLKWLENLEEPYTVQHYCATYDAIALDIFRMLEIDAPTKIETEDDYLDACYHNWLDARNELITSGEVCLECGKLREGNFLDVKWNDLPDYGDLMTLDDFIEACECGGFIDYDGSGYYSDGKREARNIPARPSNITRGRIQKRFTHVMWYNR